MWTIILDNMNLGQVYCESLMTGEKFKHIKLCQKLVSKCHQQSNVETFNTYLVMNYWHLFSWITWATQYISSLQLFLFRSQFSKKLGPHLYSEAQIILRLMLISLSKEEFDCRIWLFNTHFTCIFFYEIIFEWTYHQRKLFCEICIILISGNMW